MTEQIKVKKLADVLADDFEATDAVGLPKLAGDLQWFVKTFPSMSLDMILDFAANYPYVKETAYAGSPTEYLVKKHGAKFVDAVKEGISDKEVKASWTAEHTLTGSAENRKAAFKINKDLTENTRRMLGSPNSKSNDINTKIKTVFQPKAGSKAKPITLNELLGNIKVSKVKVGDKQKEVFKKEKMYEAFSPSLKAYSESRVKQAAENKKKRAEAKAAKASGQSTGRSTTPAPAAAPAPAKAADKPVITKGGKRPSK